MPNEYEHFIESLTHWGTKDWLNGYFDMLKRMLIQLGFNETSQQLAITVTRHGAKCQYWTTLGYSSVWR